jgi:hypothetical protein
MWRGGTPAASLLQDRAISSMGMAPFPDVDYVSASSSSNANPVDTEVGRPASPMIIIGPVIVSDNPVSLAIEFN